MGGCLTEEGGSDYRVLFSKWLRKEFCGSSALVRFPDPGTVFDYFVDPECHILPWKEMVPRYVHDPGLAFPAIFVDSEESVRLAYLSGLLLNREDGGHRQDGHHEERHGPRRRRRHQPHRQLQQQHR